MRDALDFSSWQAVFSTLLGVGDKSNRWPPFGIVPGMAGLLCFAFSTSALLTLAQQFIHLPFMDGQATNEPSGRADGKPN